MNRFIATLAQVERSESLHILQLDFEGTTLYMMTLELPQEITNGSRLEIGIKPSHVAIGKDFSGDVSFSNRLEAKITKITKGALLSTVTCDFKGVLFQSIIMSRTIERMALETDQDITLLMKASELSITRFLDDK